MRGSREIADIGYCAAKKTRFPGLHWIAERRTNRLPLPIQVRRLVAPQKKPKGKELTKDENYYNRLVRRIRQPIESLFNWIEEKTQIQRASKVRSTDALMIH